MALSCLNLNDLNPSEVLESFPGIWFVTIPDGSMVVAASENYWEKACGNWYTLPPKRLSNGLVVNWLVRALWFQAGKVTT